MNRITSVRNSLLFHLTKKQHFHTKSCILRGGAAAHHETKEHGEHHASDSHHDDHHHHEEHYTDNDGRLFGIKRGESYKFQGWELPFVTLFFGSLVYLFVGLWNKPDYSITDWSAQEVYRRTHGKAVLLNSSHLVQPEFESKERTYHTSPHGTE